MPFKIKIRNKRRRYGKSKRSFSKRQVNVIKSLALKTTNKTRELKSLNLTVNEDIIPIGGQGIIQNAASNTYVYNYVSSGTGVGTRIGNKVTPVRLTLKGWHKINGLSTSSSSREIALRVCMGYVDNATLQELENSFTATPLFWSNKPTVYTADYRDALRNFNWKAFRPIYDKTFKVRPDYKQSNTDTAVPQGKDYGMVNINHTFSKSNELTADTIATDCWQKNNLVMFCYSRLMNDDTALSTLVHEFCLEGNFQFYDA